MHPKYLHGVRANTPEKKAIFLYLQDLTKSKVIDPNLINKYFTLSLSQNVESIKNTIFRDYISGHLNATKIINSQRLPRKKINFKEKNILLVTLIRNCAEHRSIKHILKFVSDLEKSFNKVSLYFYTNNNTDNTITALKKWIKDKNNINGIFGEDKKIQIMDPKDPKKCGNRLPVLASYRNRAMRGGFEHFGKDFDYVIMFDSDLIQNIPTGNLLDSIGIEEEWSVISGNYCYYKSDYYYDVLALRFFGEDLDISKIYPNFYKFYGKNAAWVDKLFVMSGDIEVDIAFGGVSVYKAPELLDLIEKHENIFDVENYPDGSCEHIALCPKLKNKKYICGDIKYYTSADLEGTMYSKPLMLIPRDAGFFSVFNFLVGSLSMAGRVYPYFNKQAFMKMRGSNQHFSYWTGSDNVWFDFFEPISFYENDTTHTDKTFLNFEVTGGEIASTEFTHPDITKKLLSNKDIFTEWRKKVNQIFEHRIKFKKDLLDKTDKIFSNLFPNKSNIIGIHYRHPSHSIEAGNIFLKDYFAYIDKIIQNQPETEIFIASDTMFGILGFKDRYGDRVKYIQSTERLDLDNILQWAYALAKSSNKADVVGFIDNKGYELHHKAAESQNPNETNKKMLEDLLIEVLCLSKCNYLIHEQSNIPLAISYINPNLEMITLL